MRHFRGLVVLTLLSLQIALFHAGAPVLAALDDTYKVCPKCQERLFKQGTVEVNFCVRDGTSLDKVAYATKTDREKLQELIDKRTREVGELKQMRAVDWYNRGDTTEDKITKIVCFRNAVQIDPRVALYHNNLGVLYDEKQLFTESEAEFRKALEIDANYAAARSNLGKVLMEQDRTDDAIREFRRAIELDEKSATFQKNFGDALSFKQGPGETMELALKAYRRAIELDPTGPAGRLASWKMNQLDRRLNPDKYKDEGKN